MEKNNFVEILQVALFAYDNLSEDEIIGLKPDFNKKNVKIGIKLCDYLNK